MTVLRWFLSGVCHQIAAHSFVVHEEALPLCARCFGTYLGALIGLLTWRLGRRSKATALPPVSVIVVLAVFIALWALDGFNSFLTLIPGAPYLYAPHNTLRLVTGMLNGLALATLIHPLFNFVTWREPDPHPATPELRSLAAPLAIVAFLAVVAHSEMSATLQALALLGVAGLLMTLTLVNTTGVLVLLRREEQADTWSDLWLPLVLGLLFTLMEISSLALFRAWIATRGLGVGVLPGVAEMRTALFDISVPSLAFRALSCRSIPCHASSPTTPRNPSTATNRAQHTTMLSY